MADNRVTDEELNALLDRELPLEQMAALESRIDSDPELRRRVETLHSVDMAFREAMSEPLREPVPERLIAAVGDAGPARRAATGFRFSVWAVRLASAAVVLALGVSIGSLMLPMQKAQSPGAMMAALLEPLDSTPTGEQRTVQAKGGQQVQVMPLLSFRSADGAICRQYEQLSDAAGPGQSGVGIACNRGNGWRIAGYWPDASGGTSDDGDVFRPASGERDDRADRFLGSIMQGAPLSPDEEATMIENGWRGL